MCNINVLVELTYSASLTHPKTSSFNYIPSLSRGLYVTLRKYSFYINEYFR